MNIIVREWFNMDTQDIKTGIIHFDSLPRDAKIYIDDQFIVDANTKEYIRTPAYIKISEGKHYFLLRLCGYIEFGFVTVYPDVTINIYREFENFSFCKYDDR